MKNIETIIFDLDNTLVRCMVYFDFTRKNIHKVLSRVSGLSVDTIIEMFDTVERSRVTKKDGFSKEAFIDSVNTVRSDIYRKLLEENPIKAEEFYQSDDAIKLIQLTANVYDAPYTIYDDVPGVLKELKSRGYSLYVTTKGDFYGQSKKAANLPAVFDGLFVLPHKNKNTWNGVVEATQIDRLTTLVVGDSIKDDINPALQVGLNAIRIDRVNAEWVGDPKTEPLKEVPVIKTLTELLEILE